MKKNIRRYFTGMILLLVTGIVDAAFPGESEGITLESTRVIYPGSESNGITFTITNNTNNVYLLQSRVLPWLSGNTSSVQAKDISAPFVVVPPLIRFEPQSAVTLLIRLAENNLPQDRESIWMLALKAIPAQSDKTVGSEAQLILALQNNVKLFYRPAGISEQNADMRAEQLQFQLNDRYLTVTNPTPYYITLSDLMLGEQSVLLSEQRMIAPYASTQYPVKEPAASVSWQIVGDNGSNTKRQQRYLR